AWWRDQLGKPLAQRPCGDALLDLIGKSWSGGETALVALIDGWEALLAPRPLEDAAIARFVEGRATLGAGLGERLGKSIAVSEAGSAGKLWAFADLAVHARHDAERSQALEHGMRLAEQGLKLPRTLRPLAVIGGLARRSLRRGGQEMLGDRLSPLVALRLGLLGR
ncbi:MAG: hypothetical protein AB3N06_08920, partial [Erythrobacter sp.]